MMRKEVGWEEPDLLFANNSPLGTRSITLF